MRYFYSLLILIPLLIAPACRRTGSDFVTVALPESFSTLDTLTSTASDSAAERVRNVMFNGLVRKNENFEYVGELASDIKVSDDGKVLTFTLRDGVKFHNGAAFTSADVKYTFDKLFESKGYKSGAFFDTVDGKQVAHINSIETPDAKTVVFTVGRPALANQLLSNLVAIPIIPQGTAEQQKTNPVGSGPFKFVKFDQSQNTVEFDSFADYWEGAPKFAKLRVKTVTDASGLQAELQTGGVDLAPAPSNMPPDTLRILGESPNLKVDQFDGSNIQYVGLNTKSATLDNVKIRQAIGHAIDREKLIKELLSGQAKVAQSILPANSWAYSAGTVYTYDPDLSKKLLAEAGYKNEPIKFKFASSNAAFSSYAQAIQNSLTAVGLNVQIETVDPGVLRTQLSQGDFQINTGVWIGGNQDPIFLKDLFTTGRIPGPGVACCNRGRYSNPEVDKLIDQAINEVDRTKAKELYVKAWELISNDMPLLPLWYPANLAVYNVRLDNVKMNASGDWTFLKDITVK